MNILPTHVFAPEELNNLPPSNSTKVNKIFNGRVRSDIGKSRYGKAVI